MQIEREPYLQKVRDAVRKLQRLVDGEPNEVSIGAAWRQFDKIKDALGDLAPNHPELRRHR